MKKRLALIGGCGALAGVRLADYLVRRAQENGAKVDADFPEFILYSLAMQGTDSLGVSNQPMAEAQLHEALEWLSHVDCDLCLIACNTLHIFHESLQKSFTGTLLNMISLACDRAEAFGEKQVGVLCSNTTRESGLYDKQLYLRQMEPIYPTRNEQKEINAVIDDAICGKISASSWVSCQHVVGSLEKRGAKHTLIACTELDMLELNGDNLISAGKAGIDKALELMK